MLETILRWAFETWYNAFITLLIFFNILYWCAALFGLWLFHYLEKKHGLQKIANHFLRDGQQSKEIWQSMRAIFIFSLQGIVIQQGLVHHWFQLSYDFNWWFLLQVLLLFIWNEIHFYGIHFLLHTRVMMKHVHWVHHVSKEPTVYATFSFHWLEAFLLSTVIFFPLALYPFQAAAIISLPVMSIVINLVGHCNYDFFSKNDPAHLLKFSHRHSMHHKEGKGNLGFLLPWLDQLFKTNSAK